MIEMMSSRVSYITLIEIMVKKINSQIAESVPQDQNKSLRMDMN